MKIVLWQEQGEESCWTSGIQLSYGVSEAISGRGPCVGQQSTCFPWMSSMATHRTVCCTEGGTEAEVRLERHLSMWRDTTDKRDLSWKWSREMNFLSTQGTSSRISSTREFLHKDTKTLTLKDPVSDLKIMLS